MKLGIFCLLLGYVLSQFYRAFLAVLTPVLEVDIGAGADDLSVASGLWFLAFAVMQIPVGWALDTVGPRRTASVLLAAGAGGGAVVFATAQGPFDVQLAMVLMGIGCSPVLMASYYIFARVYPPAVFATLAGAVIGFGSLGNIAGSLPLAWAAETYGWRETLAGLAAVTFAVAAALFVFIKDPPRIVAGGNEKGSLLDLLKIPALWLILPMMFVNYAPAAGLRGLWIGPYLEDVFGATATGIGWASLVMGLAMVAGNFVYGPLDRVFGTRKWVVLAGNLLGAVALLTLAAMPAGSIWFAAALMAAVGLFGASFPLIMAHGRSFIPAHLTGRGVTLMNLFGIGGAGIMQYLSGRLHGAVSATAQAPAQTYSALFLFFALAALAGCAVYAFSRDRTD